MTENCDIKIVADIMAECGNASEPGMRKTGYIINFDDVDFDACVIADDNPNLIEQLILLTGCHAYKVVVPGKNPYSGTNTALTEGTYRNKFTKQVNIVILNSGPEVSRDIIDPLANGQFVLILENNFRGKGGKNTFEVYGFEQGMKASALANEKYSEETDGGWLATLQETGAGKSGMFLFNQNVKTTRQALASLVAGASDPNNE